MYVLYRPAGGGNQGGLTASSRPFDTRLDASTRGTVAARILIQTTVVTSAQQSPSTHGVRGMRH